MQSYRPAPWLTMGWQRWIAMWEVFGRRQRGLVYQDAPHTVARIISDMDAHGAEHLLVSGDLTGYGMPDEFVAARAALGELALSRARCSVIPGNHDTFAPDAVKRDYFGTHFGQMLDTDLPEYRALGPYPFVHFKGDDVAVVGLHSAQKAVLPGRANGAVGRPQLDALASLVEDRRMRHRAVLVMLHHAPRRGDGSRDTHAHGLRDADALDATLRGDRFALLHGHIHHRYHLPATASHPQTFCAGSSTMLGREGYWVIDVTDGRISGTMHSPTVAQ
jgi:3',5'-cyclic AMP phosphodiesterase CpdA